MTDTERTLIEAGQARLERRRQQWGRAVEAMLYLAAAGAWILYLASAVITLAKL
jgi:hypothetical protein